MTDFVATDTDVGQDGRVNYTITDGNQDQFFGISGAGFGEVVVRRSPLLPATYNLTITATDHGTPRRSTNATLIVHVIATTIVDCNTNDYGETCDSSDRVLNLDLLKSYYSATNEMSCNCTLKWSHKMQCYHAF